MSSILDALKKLEAAEAPPARAPAIPRERPRALGLTVAGIALAFGAGAGLTFFLRAGHAPAPAPPVVSAPPQPAAAPSPSPTAAPEARPPAPVVAVEPPLPPPAAPPSAVARRAEPPPARPPAAEESSPPEAESAPPPPLEVLPRLPAGAPHVQVSFLFYSPVAERRTVLLSVDGSGTETLHEGERAGDLEVARILPDRVHVRWSGALYSVRARD